MCRKSETLNPAVDDLTVSIGDVSADSNVLAMVQQINGYTSAQGDL